MTISWHDLACIAQDSVKDTPTVLRNGAGMLLRSKVHASIKDMPFEASCACQHVLIYMCVAR